MKRLLQSLIAGLVLASSLVIAGPVNINTADAKTLAAELEGVGEAKAAAIVAYREANGPFTNAEELLKVDGIGEATLEKNMENIRLQAE
ncbi:MAG TPA: ComEA family DNA-binding protein [Gammaproteobacteria bacterium]|nr:ComEA family DNA-binding protein [Gammaproteobacteria bacterium]